MYQLIKDGKIHCEGTHHECWYYLLTNQENQPDHALAFDGWTIERVEGS